MTEIDSSKGTARGSIYFVQAVDGGPIKIGFSRNPEHRLRGLQTGSPKELRIIALIPNKTRQLEREFHQHLAEHRMSGEWFEDHNEVYKIVGKASSRAPIIRIEDPKSVSCRRVGRR